MAQLGGIEVAWLSGRRSDAALSRAKELTVTRYFEGLRDERPGPSRNCAAPLICNQKKWPRWGTRLVDLPLLVRVGSGGGGGGTQSLEVKAHPHWVTRGIRGPGAVREVTDLILKATGTWDKLLAIWLPPPT